MMRRNQCVDRMQQRVADELPHDPIRQLLGLRELPLVQQAAKASW